MSNYIQASFKQSLANKEITQAQYRIYCSYYQLKNKKRRLNNE